MPPISSPLHAAALDEAARVPANASADRSSSRGLSARAQRDSWRGRVITSDSAVIAAMAVLAAGPMLPGAPTRAGWIAAFVAGIIWLGLLGLAGSRDYRVAGTPHEIARVCFSTLIFGATLVVVSVVVSSRVPPNQFLIYVLVGLAGLLSSRMAWRAWLLRERRQGRWNSRLLLVGAPEAVRELGAELATSGSGYTVVGACVTGGVDVPDLPVPVLGSLDSVGQAIDAVAADAVAVAGADALSPSRLRTLLWDLESHDCQLVIAAGLIDVATSRILPRSVSGVALLDVSHGPADALRRVLKRAVDLLGGGLLLVVLSPLMVACAIAVKATSPGPVFFVHERIGLNGTAFRMYKFRSMRVGADAELLELLRQQGTAQTPLFKVENDPRLTRIGPILRRLSLDELPQLINVVKGDMSLVGPRPQVAAEVALYTDAARRRLRVRPGVTGAWQVGGRSRLTWEEAMRLDLSYVENWTIVGDLGILLRTARAVLARDGAL